MFKTPTDFENNGFALVDNVLSEPDIMTLEKQLEQIALNRAGTRNLLNHPWCSALAQTLKQQKKVRPLLPTNPVAVQCTYFNKSSSHNWLVALHRDHFIPVKHYRDHPQWTAWTQKEGTLFVRPPQHVLDSLVAIRLHLEDNTTQNGPLQVIPQSHKTDAAQSETESPELAAEKKVLCLVAKGGIVAMKPLLLHSSSKVHQGSRRVLHFLFAPQHLPDGMSWKDPV